MLRCKKHDRHGYMSECALLLVNVCVCVCLIIYQYMTESIFVNAFVFHYLSVCLSVYVHVSLFRMTKLNSRSSHHKFRKYSVWPDCWSFWVHFQRFDATGSEQSVYIEMCCAKKCTHSKRYASSATRKIYYQWQIWHTNNNNCLETNVVYGECASRDGHMSKALRNVFVHVIPLWQCLRFLQEIFSRSQFFEGSALVFRHDTFYDPGVWCCMQFIVKQFTRIDKWCHLHATMTHLTRAAL